MALVRLTNCNFICRQGYSKTNDAANIRQGDDSARDISINYDKLKQLSTLYASHQDTNSRSSFHEDFMTHYPNIFLKTSKQPRKLDELTIKRLSKAKRSKIINSGAGVNTNNCSTTSHNISDYLPQLHPVWSNNKPIDESELFKSRISTLRKVLKKLPVERTREENVQLYEALQHFPSLSEQAEPRILKELCTVAVLDKWQEQNITVYGSFGFYIILAGTVQSLRTEEKSLNSANEFRNPTPEFDGHGSSLTVGDSFGSLTKLAGRTLNTRHLSVQTSEPYCEFLLITSSDFERISNKIKTKARSRNVAILQSCKTYAHWSAQALMSVADVLRWTRLRPNTVIATEGSCASYVAVVKSGEVDIIRNVDAINLLPNRQKKSLKSVTIGKLAPYQSFGEYSILRRQPMDCTMRTLTMVELAIIDAAALEGLDEDTRQLILQSCQKTFVNKTLAEVHNEYIRQELNDRWMAYKQSVVEDVLIHDRVGPTPDYLDESQE